MESEEIESREESNKLLPWVSLSTETVTQKSKYGGLVYLNSLKKFYIYKNIQIFDRLFDSPKMTRNCLTVRNKYYQQIYYIGTEGNRKPGKILPFTLRIIDQYNRFVIKIKKYFKPCFGDQVIDIECPPGELLAKMVKSKNTDDDQLFLIYGCNSIDIKFVVIRKENNKNRNEFKILKQSNKSIAMISKRYEKVLAVDKTVVYEDHYIKISTEEGTKSLEISDKVIILSATIILDIYYMSKLKT